LKEQVSRFGLEDDDEPVAGNLAQFGLGAVDAVCFGEAADPTGGRRGRNAVPAVGGGDRQHGGVRFAGFGCSRALSSGLRPASRRLPGGRSGPGDGPNRRESGIPGALPGTGVHIEAGVSRRPGLTAERMITPPLI